MRYRSTTSVSHFCASIAASAIVAAACLTNSRYGMNDLRLAASHLVEDAKKGQTSIDSGAEPSSSRRLREKLGDEIPLPGISEALKAKRRVTVIFWLLVFVGLMVATVYFTVKLMQEYNEDPTATKVKLVRNQSYAFPPVILCVDTWINVEKAATIGLTEAGIRYSLAFLTSPYLIVGHLSRQFESTFGEDMVGDDKSKDATAATGNQTWNMSKENFEQVYRRENFSSLIEFFNYISLDATLHGGRSVRRRDVIEFDCVGCDWKKSVEKVIIERDVCYKLYLNNVPAGASQSAVWYELIVRVPNTLSGNLQKQKFYWKLYMNRPSKKLVPPGTFASIQFAQTHVIRLKSEHSMAVSSDKERCVEKADADGRNYSRADCEHDCLRREVKKLMQCNLFNVDTNFKRKLGDYCHVPDAKTWTKSLLDEFLKDVSDYVNEAVEDKEKIDGDVGGDRTTTNEQEETEQECLSNCLPECDTWRYELNVDRHPSRKSVQEIENNITMSKILFVNGDAVTGGILTFTEVDTFTFDTLVGNVGGVIGLWTGASIVTILQLIACVSKQLVRCKRRGLEPLRSRRSTRREEEAMLPSV